jgi:serum/glucocorticoid-regulated kinase 2
MKLHSMGVGVSEPLAFFWFSQLIIALHHLHTHGIAHLDIKHDNILLDGELNCLLTDFGFTLKVPDYG